MAFNGIFRSEKTFYWCVRTGIGILSVLFLLTVGSRLFYPFDAGTWESFNWMAAKHLLDGENPYSFAFVEPYSMPPYGIVFYALLAAGIKIFGFQLWFGRLLTIIALGAGARAAAGIAEKITGDKESPRLAFLVVLAMFPLQIWTGVMRPDLIAAAFSISALGLVWTIEKEKKAGIFRIFVIALLAAAAFFTKQTFMLAAGIVFLRFLQVRKWREAISYAALLVFLIGTGIFLLDYTSSGGYVWQDFVHAKTLPISFSNSVGFLIEMFKQPAFSISILLLVFYIFQNCRIFEAFSKDKLIAIISSGRVLILTGFLLSTGWSFFSSGRTGANVNYYVENSFILAIVCGIICADFRRKSKLPAALAVVILLTLGGAFQLIRVLHGEYVRWQALSYYREVFDAAGKFVTTSDKCVSVNPELVVWNKCTFEVDDFGEYTGDWAPDLKEIFEREINKGKYSVIIWNSDDFQTRFPNYRRVPTIQNPPENYYKVYLYVRQDPLALPDKLP